MWSEDNQAMATVPCTENFVEFRHAVFEVYASGQRDMHTEGHTDMLIAMFRTGRLKTREWKTRERQKKQEWKKREWNSRHQEAGLENAGVEIMAP